MCMFAPLTPCVQILLLWSCLAPALKEWFSEISEFVCVTLRFIAVVYTSLVYWNLTIETRHDVIVKVSSVSIYLQVRGRCKKKPGGGNALLAVTVGYCHWLILLYSWSRLAVPDGGSATFAGYCQGQYYSIPQGGTVHSTDSTLTLFSMFISYFFLKQTSCYAKVFSLYLLVKIIWIWSSNREEIICICVFNYSCCSRCSVTGRAMASLHGPYYWLVSSQSWASLLPRWIWWLPSSPCKKTSQKNTISHKHILYMYLRLFKHVGTLIS